MASRRDCLEYVHQLPREHNHPLVDFEGAPTHDAVDALHGGVTKIPLRGHGDGRYGLGALQPLHCLRTALDCRACCDWIRGHALLRFNRSVSTDNGQNDPL